MQEDCEEKHKPERKTEQNLLHQRLVSRLCPAPPTALSDLHTSHLQSRNVAVPFLRRSLALRRGRVFTRFRLPFPGKRQETFYFLPNCTETPNTFLFTTLHCCRDRCHDVHLNSNSTGVTHTATPTHPFSVSESEPSEDEDEDDEDDEDDEELELLLLSLFCCFTTSFSAFPFTAFSPLIGRSWLRAARRSVGDRLLDRPLEALLGSDWLTGGDLERRDGCLERLGESLAGGGEEERERSLFSGFLSFWGSGFL